MRKLIGNICFAKQIWKRNRYRVPPPRRHLAAQQTSQISRPSSLGATRARCNGSTTVPVPPHRSVDDLNQTRWAMERVSLSTLPVTQSPGDTDEGCHRRDSGEPSVDRSLCLEGAEKAVAELSISLQEASVRIKTQNAEILEQGKLTEDARQAHEQEADSVKHSILKVGEIMPYPHGRWRAGPANASGRSRKALSQGWIPGWTDCGPLFPRLKSSWRLCSPHRRQGYPDCSENMRKRSLI